MTSAPQLGAAEGGSDSELMTLHGIVRVPADRFQVDGYSYTNLADAIAQARRSRRPPA